MSIAAQTTLLLPLTGADLSYLLVVLEGRANLPLPDERKLERSLRNVEITELSLMSEEEVREAQASMREGFEQARAEVEETRSHAVALSRLINEAQQRPSEFSL